MEATRPRVLWEVGRVSRARGAPRCSVVEEFRFFLILFEPKYNMVFVFLKLEIQWTASKILDSGLKL